MTIMEFTFLTMGMKRNATIVFRWNQVFILFLSVFSYNPSIVKGFSGKIESPLKKSFNNLNPFEKSSFVSTFLKKPKVMAEHCSL